MSETTLHPSAPRPLRARGVGRVLDEPRAIMVHFSDIPSDDEMRDFHDFVRDWRSQHDTGADSGSAQ